MASLICSTSALHITEEVEGPIQEVSPEEFHKIALRQRVDDTQELAKEEPAPQAKGKNKKGKGKNKNKNKNKDLLKNKTKMPTLTPEEKAAKKAAWLNSRDQRNADNNQNRHKAEEEQIEKEMAEAAVAKLAELKEAALESAETEEGTAEKDAAKEFQLKDLFKDKAKEAKREQAKKEKEKQEKEAQERAEKEKVEKDLAMGQVAKANKTFACRESGSQVLVMYLSEFANLRTKFNQEKDKCMTAQLNQHCLPYERFDATYVAPCAAGNMQCLQQRVMEDHRDCLNRNVDWEAIKSYAVNAGKDMMQVLGQWCSHVKALKEIQRRVALDEVFVNQYPAVMIMEDHVLLDKEWTEEVTKDWVNSYPGGWDLVQFDPYAGKAHADKIGEFRGKAIYRPSWKANYGGSHALLIKTAAVNTLLEKMQSLNVVPFEWIGKSMNDDPKGLEILSWEAGVSTVKWQATPQLLEYFMPRGNACKALLEDESQKKGRR